ncbi:MAG: arylsulfatase [Kordiimonadaceae bacterium]|jgi:arylsulfatase A-like enzyme|nr:arylsulfatase [Kordiimonadaceae bacterium]
MRNITGYIFAALLLVGCAEQSNEPERPNILIILADDLGYTDIGAYGGEIRTPNLDDLAGDGLLLTNFYAAPTCSPTRAMLLSGADYHLAGLGTMNGSWDTNQLGKRGYEAVLNKDVVSVSSILQDSGYHTYMTGKWHLGYVQELQPQSRGFEQSFVLLQGGASHFSDRGGLARGAIADYIENGEVAEIPDDFYSSNYYTDKMIGYIDQDRADGNPFFGYLAYTAPHWPLQVAPEDIDLYKGEYDSGYDQIRTDRIARLRELGIIDEKTITSMAPDYIESWDQLSADEQRSEARKMEIFAAMVDNLDRNIGRVIDHLKQIGEYDNTFILFMSDNGAEGNNIGNMGSNAEWIPEAFDNSVQSMGTVNSFVHYGAQWAQVGSGPYRDFKAFVGEGGIKVPSIIRYGDLPYKGDIDHGFMTVKDIAPTLLELANTTHPGTKYKGRDVYPITGKSILPHLNDLDTSVYKPEEIIVWELFGRRAIRQGAWKMTMQAEPIGSGEWQLYNLDDDPSETKDVAALNSDKIAALELLWEDYVANNNIILPINGENPYASPQ